MDKQKGPRITHKMPTRERGFEESASCNHPNQSQEHDALESKRATRSAFRYMDGGSTEREEPLLSSFFKGFL
jgi:hypothetical protein